jgi:thiamine biosynthesis protein ThiS
MNIFQGIPTVNLGLARTEQIEIWAAEDIYRFRHESPFALDSYVLQEGNRSETAMKIVLNGEPLEIGHGTTVAKLVQRLSDEAGRDPRSVAVERNREIVPKSEHAMTVLEDGDVVELVQFVGGG